MYRRKIKSARRTAHTSEVRARDDEQSTITAFPRPADDELGTQAPPESGLSVDPEDIGAQFLSAATEQQLSERFAPDAALESAGEEDWGSDPDRALASSYDLNPDGWEAALQQALSLGRLSPTSAHLRRAARVNVMEERPDDAEPPNQDDDVDLTDEVIHEASLLDHEGSELGEVESPELRTEDTHRHGKPRGGHAPTHRKRAG